MTLACSAGLVVDLTQAVTRPDSLQGIMRLLASLLSGDPSLQILALLPEEADAPQDPSWSVCVAPTLTQ